MFEKQKGLWAYGALVLAIVASLVLGVSYPRSLLPEPEIGIQAIKDTEFRSVYVAHDLDVDGDADVDGMLNVDAMDIDGAIDMGDQALTNVGAAEFDSTVDIDGAVTLNLTLDIDGNITSGTGSITMTDSLNVTSTVDFDDTLNVDGAVTFNSTFDVDGNVTSGTGAFTITDNVNVTGTVDFDSTLNVDGAATVDSLDVDNGGITLQNDETIGNATDNYITLGGGVVFNSTTITVTDAQTLTPTVYNGYRLNAAGEVTITLAVCSQDFQLLVLYGEDSQTININDTNVRTNDGAAQTLGQFDVITWMCINAEWVELSESNNS